MGLRGIEWPGEIFVPVPDYKNYEVSNYGRVWSKRSRRLLRSERKGARYLAVSLCRDGLNVKTRIHTIVLTAFGYPRPSRNHEARHFDGDSFHNSLGNLIWGTAKENSDDKRRHGTIHFGEKLHHARLTPEEAIAIFKARNHVRVGDLVKQYAMSRGAIQAIINGRSWQHVTQGLAE